MFSPQFAAELGQYFSRSFYCLVDCLSSDLLCFFSFLVCRVVNLLNFDDLVDDRSGSDVRISVFGCFSGKNL